MVVSVRTPPEHLWRNLDPALRERAAWTLWRFVGNPTLRDLKFKRLAGYSDLYSIRIDRIDRILLSRIGDSDQYKIHDVGPHDIYRGFGDED